MITQQLNNDYAEYIRYSASNQKEIPLYLRHKWQNYISKDVDPINYSNIQKSKLALAEKMFELEKSGRILFHLTVTYKPFSDRSYTEKDVSTFFKNFYIKKFLPHIMQTRNYHTNSKKALQPICYCFVDEHQMRSKNKPYLNFTTMALESRFTFPDRLHHHAILAVHEETLSVMKSLVGENTFAKDYFAPKILTSDLKQCDATRILYACKMLNKYQDFMSFPDSLIRHRSR